MSDAMLMVIGTTGAATEGEGEADAVGSDGVVPQAARSAATSTALRAAAVCFMGGGPFLGLRRDVRDQHLLEG